MDSNWNLKIYHFRNRERQRSKVGEVQATLFRQAEEEKERNRKAGVADSEEVDGEVCKASERRGI